MNRKSSYAREHRAWPAVLSIVLAFFYSGCAQKTSVTSDQLESAVDSVEIAIWRPAQIAPDDTIPHSHFYESVLQYAAQSVGIERSRRVWMDSLLRNHPLTSENLQDKSARASARKALARYDSINHELDLSIEQLRARYGDFLSHYLRSVYPEDSTKQRRTFSTLMKPTLFIPAWRPRFDSVERLIVRASSEILSFVDSVAKKTKFDTVLRFTTEEEALRYNSLASRIDSLVKEEAHQAAESTWGRVRAQ